MSRESLQSKLTREVEDRFRTFGGNRADDDMNPLAGALSGRPPCFALGVDVGQVVTFILRRAREMRQ